jgi:D-sedoheptulose 7-phosphate isomerase
LNRIQDIFDNVTSCADYAAKYVAHMSSVLNALDTEAVAKATEALEKAADENKTVFFAGNGGSAAVASHWVNDLAANTVVEGAPGYRVISLADNAPSITAIANDASFDEIFSIQLKANMRPGDIVVLLSVSGDSPNIVNALNYAKENGALTIGCSGFHGGQVKDLADIAIHMPTTQDEYGPVEDMFSIIMHIAQSYISMKRGRTLAH